jgi:hypothetical protein
LPIFANQYACLANLAKNTHRLTGSVVTGR